MPIVVFFEAQGHLWSFSFSPTPYVVCPFLLCPGLPLPSPPSGSSIPTSLLFLEHTQRSPLCTFAVSHLPEHSSPDVPMTNSFTSCKPLHKGHSLSGADLDQPYLKLQSVLPLASSMACYPALCFLFSNALITFNIPWHWLILVYLLPYCILFIVYYTIILLYLLFIDLSPATV